MRQIHVWDKPIKLFCADTLIAEHSGDSKGVWKIYKPDLIPLGLNTDPKTSVLQIDFLNWCASRVLSIDRKYAKQIYMLLTLPQTYSYNAKATIAITFRCVSLLDSYWVLYGDDNAKWEDINLRHNSLSKAIANVGLLGSPMSLSFTKFDRNAEVSTIGTFPKGWYRDETGNLWMYKANGNIGNEVKNEVCASNVIDCFNIYGNLKYELAEMYGVECSRCKLMSSDKISIIHAAELDMWCDRQGSSVNEWAKKAFLREYAQMQVIDYLIGNIDRHEQNWGFYQETSTGKILGLHPLYDHNNAFTELSLQNEDAYSASEDSFTLKEAAQHYFKYAELKLLKTPPLNMFPSQEAHDVFWKRYKQLGF